MKKPKQTKPITEVNEALKISEERMKLALEVSNAGVWEWDLTNNTLQWSEENFRLLGYEPNSFEPTFDHWLGRVHPDDKKKAVNQVTKSVETKTDLDIEFRILLPNGAVKWINDRGKFSFDKSGNPSKMYGIQFDITGRKLAEEITKKNERNLTLFIEHSPASIAMFNNEMEYIMASNRYKIDYDLGDHNLIGRSHYEIFPEITESWKAIHQRCLAGETISSEEDQFPRASGELDWVRWEIIPWYENENEIGGIILFSEVITERKQAEYKLIVSEKRYRALFENMTAGFVLFEVVLNDKGIPVDLIILVANKGFETTTGLKLQECIGKHLTKVLPGIEKDEADWIGTYGKVAITGESIQIEQGSELLGIYYSVTAYQAGTMQCAVLFDDITERKKIEKDLQVSEIHFRQLFEDNPQPMWIYDLETLQFIEVNKTALKKYGYAKDEFLKMTLKDIRPPEEVASLLKNIEKADDEYQESGVWRHQLKDGTLILVEIFSHNLLFEDKPARLVLVNDITERKKAEALLKEAEEKYRASFENSRDAILVFSKGTNILHANKEMNQLSGYSLDELNRLTLKNLFPRTNQQETADRIHNLISGKPIPPFEARLVTKQNMEVSVEISVSILRDCYGEDFVLQGNIRDVTERKKAEEEILTINKELKTLNEIITASVSSSNLNEILDKVLKEALQIVGLESGTICIVEPDDTLKLISHVKISETTLLDFTSNKMKVGESLCGNCAHNNKCPLVLNNRQEVLKYATRKVLRIEEINFHAAFPLISKEIDLGVLCVFTRTDQKPTPRSLKLLETLTSQLALAIENILLVQDLEKRVKDRTHKLQEVNKELETFSYSVSHDLKAPLRGIDGYSNLLLELYAKDLNEEAKTFITNIRNGTQQMNQIIEDLLAYSRLDRSLMKKLSTRIDVFIDHIIDLYQKELSDFHFEIDNKLPSSYIVADLDGLSIAFRNIFENALKFTKFVEKPKITIEIEELPNSWQLSVIDNGIGFDMKYYDKVFQIFQRLHRVEDYPGTGIGLAMVQKAMQRMGGSVWATSELGKGATFYLEIPKNIN